MNLGMYSENIFILFLQHPLYPFCGTSVFFTLDEIQENSYVFLW